REGDARRGDAPPRHGRHHRLLRRPAAPSLAVRPASAAVRCGDDPGWGQAGRRRAALPERDRAAPATGDPPAPSRPRTPPAGPTPPWGPPGGDGGPPPPPPPPAGPGPGARPPRPHRGNRPPRPRPAAAPAPTAARRGRLRRRPRRAAHGQAPRGAGAARV